MDYIFLKETAFENLYRLYAWDVFKYLTVHEEAFENEKINYVYNELLSYFVKRDRVNFPYSNEYKIKNKAKYEISTIIREKNTSLQTVKEFVEDFENSKHLLVIKTS